MARLPIPGADQGTWGQLLNDFLGVSHAEDGALKSSTVNTAQVVNGAISESKLDSTVQAKLNVGAGGSVADATSSTKGIVQLAGDLGGTAASPTVPGLASKANTSHTHTIANTTGLQAAIDGKASTSHAHALSSLSDVTITSPSSGQVMKYNGSAWVNDTDATGGGGGGTTDHGALTGLSDDDHPQYLNNVRGIQVVVTSNPATARPAGATSVLWICDSEPSNMTNNDLWLGSDNTGPDL